MLPGTKVVSAEAYGTSNWAKTAKLSVVLPDGKRKRFFLKCAQGKGARALAEGEYHSASAINAVVPGLVPSPAGWGEYGMDGSQVYFFLGDFHDMELSAPPEPVDFTARIAEMHRGTSPNGMFGFPVPTVIGVMEHVIKYDNETNGPWPEYDAACRQLIEVVILRLLGALQSDGRDIVPALVHGDLWEQNVGIAMETGNTIVFDPGCTYAHNEMEFGTWRCSWAFHFNSPTYMRLYQQHIQPSEPVEEWDDRNRLYSIHPYLTDSAGHPGSMSRQLAYNEMLYLCEKYGPLESLEQYDPEKDISVTGAYTPFVINQLDENRDRIQGIEAVR
ncbi:uncharacterized protein Z519_03343 [Cladophialophora bantiana CBS 173.52]|uniref:protein-ribulosamine 3-kinase n=1 Tax=Cladophialophora bantiana (strain ATCC 10958 / CBS 173.52 / CDC B-1940 / NIH 8579) TaxID=1442370 RepID=A0A0D2HZD1_CLAB1|nr:uncharacterized protein Z519_03343 [Cladophialophora bantiana CBS 173.52]KIW96275.1 hypothetical protein Z519_03343 [Cladophialophora bantiana CBS 173.52]